MIARLLARYPETVVGIKDSGGDFANTKAMLDEFPGFRVFCGSETFLTDTLAHGGAGCISAAANVNPAAIVQAFLHAGDSATPQRQAGLNAGAQRPRTGADDRLRSSAVSRITARRRISRGRVRR